MKRTHAAMRRCGWAVLAALLMGTSTVRADGISQLYEGLDSGKYLSDLRVLAEVKAPKIFTEGPTVDRRGLVYFTNVYAEHILTWNGRELAVFREKTNQLNGMHFDRNGDLLGCEGTGQVVRINVKTGERKVLAAEFNGHPLGAPNDLTTDDRGRVYFTSRLPNRDPEKGNVNSVYRIDPDGSLHRILHLPDIHMPNGIETSPDSRTLYLIESAPEENRNRCIQAYDIADDGSVKFRQTVINFYPGRGGDGMAIDAEGNLYVAAGLHAKRGTSETLDTKPGVHVVSPTGKLLAFVQTPEDTITNCAFGGSDLRTLYVTCGTKLLSLQTRIPGKPAYRPDQ